ncbi:MAG: helix-hairpin-helix domain-containing protein [Moraxellaceae bacterium]|nr:helix-hairpin-helix domain-containing protein [Moraxellaceae bacterium]
MLKLNKICLLLIIATLAIFSNAHASQCFSNAKTAYQYLLTQDKQAKHAKKAEINSIIININQADEADFVSLQGIGSKKAQAIIQYRQTHGSFSNIDELTNVKGIGKKTLDKNRQRLRIN